MIPASLLLLSAAAASPCARPLADDADLVAGLSASCPHLAGALAVWQGAHDAPAGALAALCPDLDPANPWRSCRLRRDGLLVSASELDLAEGISSAVLASRLYADLLSGGTPEPAARAAARQIAGLDPTPPRAVRASLPTPPATLPHLPPRETPPPCAPAVTLTASGQLRSGGAALSPTTAVEAGLWTVHPDLRATPPAEDCIAADIAADVTAPASALAPLAESLSRAGYARLRLLGVSGPVSGAAQDALAPLSHTPLRIAPGGTPSNHAITAHLGADGAVRLVTEGGSQDLSLSDLGALSAALEAAWTGDLHVRWPAEVDVTVGQVTALIAASGPSTRLWIDTRLQALQPIETDASMLGTLLLPSDPERAVLDDAVDARMEGLYDCYRAGLRRQPGLAGRVTLELAVSGTGEIQSARIRAASLTDLGTQSCMLERMADGPLPATGKPAILTYRLTFSSERR